MTRLHLESGIWACAIALACALPTRGQVPPGLPPFGSFSGGPDIVNVANRNVHIAFPVVAKGGRGVPFTYTLSYDNSVWSPYSGGYYGAWSPPGYWGWTAQSQAEYDNYDFLQLQLRCDARCQPDFQNCVYYNEYRNWRYIDGAGTPHAFTTTVNDSLYSCGVQKGGSWSATATTTDGSGWTMTFDATPEATFAYDIHGDTFDLQNGSLQDSNGNLISGWSTITDTLGLTALTIAGLGTPTSPRTYTYTAASGQSETVTVKYTPYTVKTNFGCGGVTEYGPRSANLVSEIDLPDGTKYTFSYEATPGYPGDFTARVSKVTLPLDGEIDYSYSGIDCSGGSTVTLTRTLKDNNGNSAVWTYSGSAITAPPDPQGNQAYIALQFQGPYETERDVYQRQGGTLLETVYTCYNGAAFPCDGTAITPPITQRTVTTSIGGQESQVKTYYNGYAMPTEADEYDYGSGAVGALLRKTTIAYASPGGYIRDRPATVTVYKSDGVTVAAQTTYTYDGSAVQPTSGVPQHISVSGARGNLDLELIRK